MTCGRCGKRYKRDAERCPHCGESVPAEGSSGVYQTSTVLISSGSSDLVYRSVEEVPGPLRSRLEKSTSGANSATLLIADRRGRAEIARAMRALPGPVQRKLLQAVVGDSGDSPRFALTRLRRVALLAALVSMLAAVVWLVFFHR